MLPHRHLPHRERLRSKRKRDGSVAADDLRGRPRPDEYLCERWPLLHFGVESMCRGQPVQPESASVQGRAVVSSVERLCVPSWNWGGRGSFPELRPVLPGESAKLWLPGVPGVLLRRDVSGRWGARVGNDLVRDDGLGAFPDRHIRRLLAATRVEEHTRSDAAWVRRLLGDGLLYVDAGATGVAGLDLVRWLHRNRYSNRMRLLLLLLLP